LDEDRHDHVELGGRPRPSDKVHLLKLHIDSSQRRQRTRFLEGIGREVEREDVEAELGEPDPVAAFAIRQRKRSLASLEAMRLALQECVRRGSEQVVRRCKTRFPTLQFRHESFQSRSAWWVALHYPILIWQVKLPRFLGVPGV
jgi:hypothetical protein